MKRILPVIIAFCLIALVFLSLPKSEQNVGGIGEFEDLNNAKIGIQTGLNYEVFTREMFPDAEICMFTDFSSLIPAVLQGKIDVFLTDSPSFPIEKKENPSLERIKEPMQIIDDCCIGVSKFNNGDKILSEINEFLKEIKENGEYDEMHDYWIENYDPDNCTVDKSGITGENGILRCTAEAAYEPICMTGENGELIGYDIDMIYRFCRKYGYEPKIEPLEFDAMPAALASGKCDIATGLIKDDERAEEIIFSDIYLTYEVIAAYNTSNRSGTGFWANLSHSFEKTFIKESRWKMFGSGILTTILIALLSVLFGTLLGLLLFLWCFHGKKTERSVTGFLCWIMSSTPSVVLLMVLYYVIFKSFTITNIAVSVIGFSLVFGCSFYEIIQAGVKAVGNGQMEAARAQGFSKNQAFFRIIFPQAIEHFTPAYKSEIVSIIQETSIVGYIAVLDLTKMSDLVRARTYDAFFPLIATALMYFLIIWLFSLLTNYISKKTLTKNRKPEKIIKF